MQQAKAGDTVSVHYTGTLNDGSEFDSSKGREPLQFTLGEGQVIQGFDKAVDGMKVGDTTTVTIPAGEAYGEYLDAYVIRVGREEIPDDLEVEIGAELTLTMNDGGNIPVRVTDLSETSVTLDANHPLAGKDLIFEIELVGIA